MYVMNTRPPGPPAPLPAFIPAILAVVCLAIGLPFFFFGRAELPKARTDETWIETQGTVVSSRVVESSYRDQDTGQWEYVENPEVIYNYTVDERTYEGYKLTPINSSDGTPAREIVEKYPAGAKVPVYYDPDDPSDAALSKESSILGYVLLSIGIGMSLIGLPFAVWAARIAMRRAQSR
jgi:hypothetical protein